MHPCQNFKLYNLQEKPASYIVLNGGWIIYEKANHKGKYLYHHDGDCFSNDPINPKGRVLNGEPLLGEGDNAASYLVNNTPINRS